MYYILKFYHYLHPDISPPVIENLDNEEIIFINFMIFNFFINYYC